MTVKDPAAETGADEQNTTTKETKENEANEALLLDGKPFDPERAMATIRKQRESEDALKEELAEFRAQEAAKAEAEKTQEQRIVEKEARILELEAALAMRDANAEFKAEAEEAGIADPDLALLVAKEDGLLGTYDPKTGKVKKHKVDFDALVEEHPVLAGSRQSGERVPGDAARVGGKEPRTLGAQFNRAVRGK